MPNYKRTLFELKGFDSSLYQKFYHRFQSTHQRLKLDVVKAYSEKKSIKSILDQFSISIITFHKYINLYLKGGFDSLCKPITRKQPFQLTESQRLEFRNTLLHSRPCDHGLTGNIWTGNLMKEHIKKVYQVIYHSGIYDLLKSLGLSHQKAHLDYGNADLEQQKKFIETLKMVLLNADSSTTVIKFDEFSVCERPTSFYGWAEKNTRPKVVTNEKKKKDLTDF
jgi:transposase